MNSSNRQWQFWVDRGGTFTDIVACKPNGQLISHKLLSDNPEQYLDAALQGIKELLKQDVSLSITKQPPAGSGWVREIGD